MLLFVYEICQEIPSRWWVLGTLSLAKFCWYYIPSKAIAILAWCTASSSCSLWRVKINKFDKIFFFVGKIIFRSWLDMTFRIFIFLLSCPSFEQGAQLLWKSHGCWDIVWDWTGVKLDIWQCCCHTVTAKFFSGLVLWVNSEHISCLIYSLPYSLHSHFSTLINFQTLSHPFSFLNHTDLSFWAFHLHFLLIFSVLSVSFGHLNS